jgi:hypothetical protein
MATTAVVAGTAGAVRHHQDQRYEKKANEQAAQQQAQYDAMQQQAQYEAQQQAAAAPAQANYMAELERLGQLHSQGILTDEEFQAKKAQLLGL